MDESTARSALVPGADLGPDKDLDARRDGFEGQRMLVLPKAVVRAV